MLYVLQLLVLASYLADAYGSQINLHSKGMLVDIYYQHKKIDRLIQIQALLEKRVGIVQDQMNEVIATIGKDVGLCDFIVYKTVASDLRCKCTLLST